MIRRQPIYFDDVVYAAETAIAHDINHEEMESSEKYYQKKYESIPKYVSKQNLIEYLEYKILMDKMKNDGGPQGLETQLADFIDRVKSKERLNRISNETSRWSHLKKGSLAPNFTAFERDGKEVKLEDLRGKNVYIDVWATWCGPCIREIPSLKLMEEKYHGENVEFVSVSIDNEKDKQKWKDFVVERELGGTQIMAENAWRSGIATNYNINSIPRFMMVDKQGKLVSVNAPRPSMEKQFNSMLADVLE